MNRYLSAEYIHKTQIMFVKRGNNTNTLKLELWSLCTAFPSLMLYLHTKLNVSSFTIFREQCTTQFKINGE